MSDKTKNFIALSFDVEDWYHTPLVSGASFSKYAHLNDFLSKENDQQVSIDRITSETLRIIDILEKHNIKATFFLVADVAQRYQKITDALRKTDHEIGCHSLTHHTAIHTKTKQDVQDRQQWKNDQQQAKEILEDLFQREVIGYRAPGAWLANWMIPVLIDLGFQYDSSVTYNTVYNKTNVKLQNVPDQPYFINADKLNAEPPVTSLMELPWSNLSLPGGIRLPVGGAYFFRLLGHRYFSFALKRALKKGDTMFYIHPYDIARGDIPAEASNRPAFWINKGMKTEKNFVKLLESFPGKFTTCKDVFRKNQTVG
ncbi:MAG: polysaccharide deacetylase family protein [Bacteroidota bacterium]